MSINQSNSSQERIRKLENENESLKQALAELQQDKDCLLTIVNNTPAPIYLKSSEGKYIFVNKRFEELAHTHLEQMKGKNDHDIFPEPIARLFQDQDNEIKNKNTPIEFEETIPLPDGEFTFITSKFPVRDKEDKIIAVGGFCTDITVRKKIEAELVHVEKMASLGQLIAGIAHEINNSTNFISGALSPLADKIHSIRTVMTNHAETGGNGGDDPAKLFNAIDILLSNMWTGTDRLVSIVHKLLHFTRKKKAPVTADIHDELDTTLELLYHEYKHKIDIIKRYDTTLPPVSCYPDELNQVFMNIIINAVQALDQKGKVEIKTWGADNTVHISIEDNGPGISENIQKKIFDPFFTTKEMGKGTGLGLSISHEVIRKHQGEIRLHSKPGEGARFEIILPASPTAS